MIEPADWRAPHFECYTQSPRHDLSPAASAKAHRIWLGWRCTEWCGGMLEWRRRKRRRRETEGEGRAAESKGQGLSTARPILQRKSAKRPAGAAGNPPGKGAGPCAACRFACPPGRLANSLHRRLLHARLPQHHNWQHAAEARGRSTAQPQVAQAGIEKERCQCVVAFRVPTVGRSRVQCLS